MNPRFKKGDIVTLKDRVELYRVELVAYHDYDTDWYRIRGTEGGLLFTVSYKSITKVIDAAKLWREALDE